MYNRWSKSYDFKPNLAVFLEEKVIVKWFNYKDKNILDLGCGTGRYSIPLGKNNSVVGVDISEGMLKIAKQKAIKNKVNISFIKQDITKYAAKDRFDVIVSMLVQDHIKNLKSLVKNIDKASKIGTELIISNVHPIHTLNTIKNKNKAIVAKDLKFSTDQYYHPLSEYMALLGRLGFVLEDYAEPLFLKKYLKIKAFSNLKHLVNKPIIAIYKFKKIR
jgi:malonyl-CoA O-methyltransferase